jgi:hypothetical protein
MDRKALLKAERALPPGLPPRCGSKRSRSAGASGRACGEAGEPKEWISASTERDQARSHKWTQSSPKMLDAKLHRPLITPRSFQVRIVVMIYLQDRSVITFFALPRPNGR